jgi:microcin C transport system substrate-binding protein
VRLRLYGSLTGLAGAILLTIGCGGGSAPPASTSTDSSPSSNRSNVSLDKNSYPVFPNADAGADPSVPAEQGGKGFKGEGWETSLDYDLIGDPRAVNGGVFVQSLSDSPGTIRLHGPESNTSFNYYVVTPLVYEPLLYLHPTTLQFIPALSTHWQISADKMTYRFRLNPNARWSDGRPVVADDVVATWKFMMDKGLQDPSNQLTFGKLEQPVAESKYIVSVKSKQLNWRNFLYFASMPLLPSHVLSSVDGARYLKEYNFKTLPGTGPYTINESDVVKGKSISVRRRNDYWAEKDRRNVGLYNFDEVRSIVVRDNTLQLEMFKKGDIDFYYVGSAREWVEEFNFDRVQRGLIQKAKVFNDNPSGFNGFAMNTRKAPFDDIRVRRALAAFLNRELMIEKLFFKEYIPQNSYHSGGIYENPNNPKNPYDPSLGLKLLAEAGWNARDGQGRLTKAGRPLILEMLYYDKTLERYLTVYQEDLRKAGITLNLRLVTGETMFKLLMQRKFDMADMAWGALLFPNPETSFSSAFADVENNNNITGFKNKRVDELLPKYDVEFDQQKRIEIIKEIDGILANEYHYVLKWDGPYQRMALWNKFGHPQGYLSRVGDFNDMVWMWWNDPEKTAQLKRAMADSSVKMPTEPVENRYWKEFAKKQGAATN